MNLDYRKLGARVFGVAASAALALSLAACGDKPAAAPAAAKMASTAEAAPGNKMTEASKPGAPKNAADAKPDADAVLSGKVKAAIYAAPGLNNMPMDVRSSEGRVTLFGTADDDAQRSEAEKVAARVPGVKSVKNELLILRGS
jgi:osmotically-inducible protein OsmY